MQRGVGLDKKNVPSRQTDLSLFGNTEKFPLADKKIANNQAHQICSRKQMPDKIFNMRELLLDTAKKQFRHMKEEYARTIPDKYDRHDRTKDHSFSDLFPITSLTHAYALERFEQLDEKTLSWMLKDINHAMSYLQSEQKLESAVFQWMRYRCQVLEGLKTLDTHLKNHDLDKFFGAVHAKPGMFDFEFKPKMDAKPSEWDKIMGRTLLPNHWPYGTTEYYALKREWNKKKMKAQLQTVQ